MTNENKNIATLEKKKHSSMKIEPIGFLNQPFNNL